MAIPTIYFLFNKTLNDIPYSGSGESNATYSGINISNETLVFTGGGIDDSVLTPTCASGTRSSTIKPDGVSYVIPETYVEDASLMTHIPLVGYNVNIYSMCVYVNGYASSDIYLEAWDDNTFSTTNLAVLQGSPLSGNESYINAIRTTGGAPPPDWNGGDVGAAYLRGTSDRVPLANDSSVTDQALYYNIYIRLEDDSATFHNEPVLAFRYLYT